MRLTDYNMLHGWNRHHAMMCRSGDVCVVVRALRSAAPDEVIASDAGALTILPAAMFHRHQPSRTLIAIARAYRGVLRIESDGDVVPYALLKTLTTLVNVKTLPDKYTPTDYPQRFRPIDNVPWHIHMIEDEEAYATALKGFLDTDAA